MDKEDSKEIQKCYKIEEKIPYVQVKRKNAKS